MATNTNPFYTYSATAGSSKTLQKPQDGGDNNQWGNYINTDLDEIVSAVNALSDKIADANEKTLVDFTATGSAVNHVGITNAAAGSGPTLSATGDDTNIDLNIAGKGSGTAKFTSNIIIPNAGNIGSVSDPDAIAIASDGGLTFNGGIDNAGTISAGTFNGTIGSSATFPSGTIIQVQTTTLKTAVAVTSISVGGTAQITGLNTNITPKFNNSTILLSFNVHVSGPGGGIKVVGVSATRGGSAIETATGEQSSQYTVTASNSQLADIAYISNVSMTVKDSGLSIPSTPVQITYGVLVQNLGTQTSTMVVNRTEGDTNNANNPRAISTLTVYEIAG